MSSDSSILLTTDDLQKMDDDIQELEAEISRAEETLRQYIADRDILIARRRSINELLAAMGKISANLKVVSFVKIHPPLPNRFKAKAGRNGVGGITWITEISRLLSDYHDGITYDELRAGIHQGPLSERLTHSDKGLYGGVGKLEARGELVKHRGKLFNVGNHKTFMERVAAGLTEDVAQVSYSARSSPIGEAILNFIEAHPFGVEGSKILDELKRDPRFSEVVSKSNSAAYNVFKRLVDRGQIRKEDKAYFPATDSLAAKNNSGAGDDRS